MIESKMSWIYLLSFLAINPSIQKMCRNEQNNPVDWFVIYKLPELKHSENSLIEKGSAYAYISSNDDKGWILSKKSITDKESIPGLTLAPIYEEKSKKKSLLYFLYNDQPPNKGTSHGGHLKGVVVAGKTGGFWLVHSVPNYPSPPTKLNGYTYPKTGHRFGQSFLCITLKPRDLELAGDQLRYMNPAVFAKSVPKHLKKIYPILTSVINGEHVESPPWNNSRDIRTAGGSKLQVFSKASEFNKDLYIWMASDLKVSLLVETWRRAQHILPSYCKGKYRVENVLEVEVSGVLLSWSQDHSKWAVSNSKNQPWVCIGDINRHASQEKRGGGAVCMKNKPLWEAYFSSVSRKESCKGSYRQLLLNPAALLSTLWDLLLYLATLYTQRSLPNEPYNHLQKHYPLAIQPYYPFQHFYPILRWPFYPLQQPYHQHKLDYHTYWLPDH